MKSIKNGTKKENNLKIVFSTMKISEEIGRFPRKERGYLYAQYRFDKD
jgi:hypothetical protein